LSAKASSQSTQETYKRAARYGGMARRDNRRELEEYQAEETFHKHEWLVQRVGWVGLAVVLAGACAGLLGNGPLSHHVIAVGEGILKIDRFARRDAPTVWVIEPAANLLRPVDFKLEISASLLDRVKIEAITPAPRDQAATSDAVSFTFNALAPRSKIVFHVEPQNVGWIAGDFQLGDSQPVKVRQFVYP
jgi:hypothetical protein